jgi:hypothetical protein
MTNGPDETLSIRTGEVGFIIFSVTNPGSYTHQLLNYAAADVDGVVPDAAPVRLYTLYLRGPGGRFRDRRRTRDPSLPAGYAVNLKPRRRSRRGSSPDVRTQASGVELPGTDALGFSRAGDL